MSLVVEGHGFSVSHAGVSITQNPISIEIPGFTRAELDRTTQGNTAVKTGRVAKLRAYENFTHTYPHDQSDIAAWEASSGSALQTITFPDSLGTYTVYCEVLSVGNVGEETDNRPTYEVTFKVTNLNGTTETAPSFSAGS
jgi:hypothetical protein